MNQTELEALRQVAGRASSLLGSLANPDRLMILCTLVQGECNVGELAQRSGIVQPTLSQQLTVLRREELIASRKEGKYVYYRLENPAVLAVMQTLYGIFCAPGGTDDCN
ncbi:metalloregulator ArsR/SmtB family transcription factor [Alcaligenes faecalis]|jgi:DNA-binding transcriptional ArsR family regulator|uniref:Metalloregulator ArsR/SmtB family transcription factor n=1 Tax=Alcaligenes faecalis TaxID=511 RepID=A0ABY7N7Z6_ALCFA|nr:MULTISPECIES: metalloregulator ArsR/SmtB family transcription factor [Alcaligenes]ALO39516.1 ArsR family transcriptional regulator [Alcaligenes faecalis]KAA1284428.1 transcriptional regulator [Alcaligenes faecalis]MBQ0217234.1 helix-turn-helix transcriptional regulator [Alcaligenes faecalis]MBW4789639.1 metalloregulator ArsR/SmtB family transcription factor [Alcaligenes faecalis subsp. faecalis]MCB4324208.1 metalloregulator ArsR/SmtB family transcription factor [Alcaligenes sp. 13f]